MVAGGMAVNLYGIERATGDIDIIIDTGSENIRRFVGAMEGLGFKPKVPVGLRDFADEEKRERWRKEKGMVVFSLYDPKNPFILLDVFTEVPFDFKKVYGKRVKMRIGKTVIPVIPIEELITIKAETSRAQDRADVFYLKKIRKEWTRED